MKNFPYTIESDLIVDGENIKGKTFWHSRAVAVVGIIFTLDLDNCIHVLAEKRGSGAADFQGLYCCPCGYVDFNETTKQTISRETLEETGLLVNPEKFQLFGVSDDPNANNQNVTLRYVAYIANAYDSTLKPTGGEKNEVEEVLWIPVSKLNGYQWAFGHGDLIMKAFNGFYE